MPSRKQADSSEACRKAKACLLSSIRWENPCHCCFTQMLTFTERTVKQEKGELTNCQTIKEVVFGTKNSYYLASFHASHVRLKALPFLIFRELLRSV